MAGKPFDQEHSLISSPERGAIPAVVYDKVTADGITLEKLGTERLWLALEPIWADDRPHICLSQRLRTGSRRMSTCRNSAIMSCWTTQFVRPWQSWIHSSATRTPSIRRAERTRTWSGRKNPPALLAETAAFVRAADVKELLSRRNAPSSPVPASSGDSAPVPNGEPRAAKWRCYTDRA